MRGLKKAVDAITIVIPLIERFACWIRKRRAARRARRKARRK